MLLMWAPIHHLLLLSTKMPMGILHCLWATTWSVFAVPVLEGVGRVLFTYFTFIFDLRAGLEKLCRGLQKPCFNMASKTTLRLRSSWVCCGACFWGAPSWLCSMRGWETHRGCGVWGANHMGVIRCLPMGMLYLPSSERLTAVHGTSCPKRTVWAEAQEDIGVACTASIRDSATRKASIPCVKLWKRMYIIHIRACKKTRLWQRRWTSILVHESSKKATSFGPLFVCPWSKHTHKRALHPSLFLGTSVVNYQY